MGKENNASPTYCQEYQWQIIKKKGGAPNVPGFARPDQIKRKRRGNELTQGRGTGCRTAWRAAHKKSTIRLEARVPKGDFRKRSTFAGNRLKEKEGGYSHNAKKEVKDRRSSLNLG